ncbi:hypothetical protein CW368_11850 [Actinomycetales bacterium SN12]|nr:hypothetical protein CW368_11850 [Actinomycetales bacterium SN12]
MLKPSSAAWRSRAAFYYAYGDRPRKEQCSMIRPTPLLIARRHNVDAVAESSADEISVDDRRRDDLLDLLARVALVGPSSADDETARLQQPCIPELDPFSHERLSGQQLVDIWISILDGGHAATLTELLFIEYWASIGYQPVRQALGKAGKRFKYTQTLFAIRKRVAFNLYDYARELNWQQPVTFVSALKAARAYLRDAAGHSGSEALRDYGQFTGKLGVATVLIAGFEAITQDEAREAYDALRCSLDHGNTPGAALPYLVNAAVLSFDFSGDLQALTEALEFSQSFETASRSTPLRLAVAQAQLRIALATEDNALLARIGQLIDSLKPGSIPRVPDFLTARILRGIVSYLQIDGICGADATHLRVPFGYRTGDETHALLVASAREVYKKIRLSQRLDDPMVANLLADLIVNCRAGLKIDEVEALRAALKYRTGAETGRVFGLVRAQNELELASLEQDSAARLRATERLAEIATDVRFEAAAHIVLAHNLENWGPIGKGRGGTSTRAESVISDLVSNAVDGTARDLWLLAAKSAFENANLIKRSLGGRSSVTTVGDYFGLVTETLVFKQMDKAGHHRGSARSEAIQRYLEDNDLDGQFGVPTILDAKDTPDSVVVAHRFVSGVSLMKVFEKAENSVRLQRAVQAARFLGLINRSEAHAATDDGVRRTLKAKEVGRFLKSCGLENWLEIFDRWWQTVADIDSVTRKDAHLDNWILAQGEELIAIDWEASGCRPLGYELAQITDDHAYFPVEAWETRRAIFDSYLDQVEHASSTEDCWRAYKAGVLARHLWAITSPERAKRFDPGEAETRLQAYALTVDDAELASLANIALKAVLKKRGLSTLPPATSNTTGAGRVRLSKQIAYVLRHDLEIERDDSGWVRTALLAERLTRVSCEEVAAVATDPREARFEVRGDFIRARYGHNAELHHTILFENSVAADTRLYHASPWGYASEILDRRSGLRAKSRGMVHLTDSFSEAVASGVRGGHPLVYETQASRLGHVTKAGELTYLTPYVSHNSLRVVPMSSYWTALPALSSLLPKHTVGLSRRKEIV